ncbi:MAG: response regulator transcription factor [Cyanobacteria bacterium J06576_12]
MNNLKIMVVEDDPLFATEVEMLLTSLNKVEYQLVDNIEAARRQIQMQSFQLILLDIHLQGPENGLDFGRYLRQNLPTLPIVFMTAHTGGATYEKARSLMPYAFLVKPVELLTLRSIVEAILDRHAPYRTFQYEQFEEYQENHVLREHLFVKTNNRFSRVQLSDVRVIEADGNYAILYANERKYVVKISVKQLLQQLSSQLFIRVHRNFAVQIPYIDNVDFSVNELTLAGKPYPIGSKYKSELAKRLNRIS